MLSRNAQIWETNLFNWVFGGSGVFLVLQNSLRFLCRHALFTSGCWCSCVSLRFPCQTFRTSVFVPRSPASNLKTIATKSSLWTVLVHEAEFSWFGPVGFFCNMCCANSLNLFTTHPFCGENFENTINKLASVAYHDSTLNIYFFCVFHWTTFTFGMVFFDISCMMSGHSKFGMVIFWNDDRSF